MERPRASSGIFALKPRATKSGGEETNMDGQDAQDKFNPPFS
jgi:hypothetical protein